MTAKRKWLVRATALWLFLPAAAIAEDAPGVFTIPGTSSTLKIYGYAQLNLAEELEGTVGDALGADPGLIPSDPNFQKKPQFLASVSQSRFGFTTTTPSAIGSIGTRVEGDFVGTNAKGNSVNFRVRYAYGTVDDFLLLGQTWGTFWDSEAFADTVDFNGPIGYDYAAFRAPMARVTIPLDGVSLSLAAEKASSVGVPDGYSPAPDLVAAIKMPVPWGHIRLAGVAQIYQNTAVSSVGWGVNLAGAVDLYGDALVYGVLASSGSTYGGNGVVVNGTSVDASQSIGYSVGYTHVWSPAFRSNLVWSQVFNKADAAVAAATDIQRIDEGLVNTFWAVTNNFNIGLEYAYGRKYLFGGDNSAVQSRLQSAFRYNFF